MERSDPKGGRVITFDRLRLNCQRNFTGYTEISHASLRANFTMYMTGIL